MNPVIEPGIRPLVDAMNATGVFWTVASCEGHRWSGERPYVYFVAPPEAVSWLGGRLEQDALSPKPLLNYYWKVTGHFTSDGDIRFALEAAGLSTGFWRATALRHDIETLTALIQQFSHFGPQVEIGIDRKAYEQNEGDYIAKRNVYPISKKVWAFSAACWTTVRRRPNWSIAFTTRYESHKHLLIPCSQQGILTQFVEVRS